MFCTVHRKTNVGNRTRYQKQRSSVAGAHLDASVGNTGTSQTQRHPREDTMGFIWHICFCYVFFSHTHNCIQLRRSLSWQLIFCWTDASRWEHLSSQPSSISFLAIVFRNLHPHCPYVAHLCQVEGRVTTLKNWNYLISMYVWSACLYICVDPWLCMYVCLHVCTHASMYVSD